MKTLVIGLLLVVSVFQTNAQIRLTKVDVPNNRVVIKNFGGSAVDISGYWFCHSFAYHQVSDGTIVSGSSNLAAGAQVELTLSQALNNAGSDLSFYSAPSFGSSASMVDFTQWGSGGNGRENVAVAKGVWTAGQFVNATGTAIYYKGTGSENGLTQWSTTPPPSITSMVRQTPTDATTDADEVTFRVTFSDDVRFVSTDDFVLSGTAAGDGTISSVTAVSSSVYDVNITGITNSTGTINLDLKGVDGSGSNNIAKIPSQLDVNSTADIQITDSPVFGQSFRPNNSGLLLDVVLKNGVGHSYSGPGTLELLSGEGYGGSVLATENIQITAPHTEKTYSFSSPPSVTAGTTYTLRVNIPGAPALTTAFSAQVGAGYSGGILYQASALSSADLYFKLFISSGPSEALGSFLPSSDETYTIKNPPIASNVSFSGTLSVEELLTGTYDYTDPQSNGESGTTFRWLRADDADGSNKSVISGATALTYTTTAADAGKFLIFEVTPSDGTDTGAAVESSAQEIVSPLNIQSVVRQTPTTSSIDVTTSPVFRVTFSEGVRNVDTDDFVVNSTVGGTVSNVAAVDTKTYDVTVNNLNNANGTLGLKVKGIDGATGSNDITGIIYSNGTAAHQQTTQNDYLNQALLGQSFTAASNNYFTAFTLFPRAGQHSFTGTARLRIFQGDASSAAVLADANAVISTQTIDISSSTAASGQTFTISNPTQLTSGTVYSIVLDNFTGSGSRAFNAHTSGSLANGRAFFTNSNNSSHAAFDFMIDIFEGTQADGSALFDQAPGTNESYTLTQVLSPFDKASNAVLGASTTSTINIASFTAASDADGYVIKARGPNSSTTPPTDGNSLPSLETYTGSSEKVVYTGTSITPNITLNNLQPNTDHALIIYAYKLNGGNYNFQQVGYEFYACTKDNEITVTSIVRQTPTDATTDADQVVFRVTFAAAVINVDATDFTLSGTAAGDGTIGNVNAVSTTVYDVTVTGVTNSNGTINLDIKGNNGVTGTNNIQKLSELIQYAGQSHGNVLTGNELGASFLASRSGRVQKVFLRVTQSMANATFKIYEGEGFGGTVVGSATMNAQNSVYVDVPGNISLTAGTVYTWSISHASTLSLPASNNDAYTYYRTYVDGAEVVARDIMSEVWVEKANADLSTTAPGTDETFTMLNNAAPTATNVSFSGILEEGEQLSGTYTYADAENDTESGTTFKWYRSDDNAGTGKTAISGATSQTYTLVADDGGKHISFEVTPNDGISAGTAVESTLQGAVPSVSVTSIVRQTPTDATTSADQVTFRVTFDASVTNVDKTDFSLSGTASADGTISTITAINSKVYDVLVTGISSSNGTLGLQIANGNDVEGPVSVLEQLSSSGTRTDSYVNQTFIAPESGPLTHLRFWTEHASFNLTLTIKKSGTTLHTQAITTSDGTGVMEQNITLSTPIAVIKGDVYEFRLSTNSGHANFRIDSSDPYAGGLMTSGFGNGANWDLQFSLTIDTPGAAGLTAMIPVTNESYTIFNNVAPEFTSQPVTSVNDNAVYTYDITTSDLNGDEVSITGTTIPGWLSLNQNQKGVSTLSGTGLNKSGSYGPGTGVAADGTLDQASFSWPSDIVIDDQQNTYILDRFEGKLRKITSDGNVTTIAGSEFGSQLGTGTNAQLKYPEVMTLGNHNIMYVPSGFSRDPEDFIRKIDVITGVVTAFAGGLKGVSGLAYDRATDILYASHIGFNGEHEILKFDTQGNKTVLAGDGTGFTNGTGTEAKFYFPRDLLLDGNGNLYVSDQGNNSVRKIELATGIVSTVAGGTRGSDDGTGTDAQFNGPFGLTMDAKNNLYVADRFNYIIRKIDPSGVVTTIAGIKGESADLDGSLESAKFFDPDGLAIDAQGNLLVADQYTSKIRKISFTTSLALSGNATGQTAGDYGVTLTANDGNNGTAEQNFSITVVDVTAPAKPVITHISDDTGISDSDGITNDANIIISGTAEPLSGIEVFTQYGPVRSTQADANGSWLLDISDITLVEIPVDLTAVSVDLAGNRSAVSDIFKLKADFTAPAKPVITHISDDTGSSNSDGITNDANIIISGTAEPLSGIEVFTQYGPVRSTQTDVNGDWVLDITDITLVEIPVDLTAVAVDLAGNRSAVSDIFKLKADFTAPAKPVITHISDDTGSSNSDGITNDANIIISGTAEPLSGIEVFTQYGPVRSTQTDANGDWVLDITDITLVEIPVDLTAVAVDLAGNRSMASDIFKVTPDFTAPAKPVITHISDDTGSSDSDGITNDANIIISGTAEPLSGIEVFTQYGPVRSTQTDANGDWVLDITDITLIELSVDLTAVAVDLAGNRSMASNIFKVTPDFTPPPKPVITGFTEDPRLIVRGTAEAGAEIELLEGSVSLGTGTADANGSWLVDLGTNASGEATINVKARAMDVAGNVSTSDTYVVTSGHTGPTVLSLQDNSLTDFVGDRSEKVSLYPNPASDILTIDLSGLSAKEVNIHLYDAAGAPVFTRTAFKENALQINVSGYRSGLYIVQLYDGLRIIRKKVMLKK